MINFSLFCTFLLSLVIKPLDRSNPLSRLIAIKETVSNYPAYTSMRLILEAYWIFEQYPTTDHLY